VSYIYMVLKKISDQFKFRESSNRDQGAAVDVVASDVESSILGLSKQRSFAHIRCTADVCSLQRRHI